MRFNLTQCFSSMLSVYSLSLYACPLRARAVKVIGVMNKKRLMIDMDGVLCDFAASYSRIRKERPEIEFPQSIPGIFANLEPISGAVPAVNRLRKEFDVWVLSAPSVRNPHCYTEKRIWIEKYFGLEMAYKLILAHDKSLINGDILIDDNVDGKGQEQFSGRLIHFGSLEFPDWDAVEMALLVSR